MSEFTPEQEKRINELIEQREKRAGLLGWLFGIVSPSVFALLLLPVHFQEVDETVHSWKDTIEDAPVVLSYVGEMASNFVDLARHGQLPTPHDPNLITFYSSGTNSAPHPVSGMRIGTSFAGITAPAQNWALSGDGTIKVILKKPLV